MKRLALAACITALVAPGSARADATVTIGPTGFFPATVTVRAGEAVHWTSSHFLTQSVTSTGGLFDSGPIPAGGGFTMALRAPGEHAYVSAANPLLTGRVRVIARSLGGPAADPARDWVPELQFPVPEPADVATHPRLGTRASATRILLRPAPDATVGEVDAALAAVDAEIVGGLPSLGTLLVVVAEEDGELGRFTGLADALESLRASGAFESASMSTLVREHAVPRRAEASVEGVVDIWSWEENRGQANWGLKDARFPEAWNLRESLARRNPGVVTGIVDVGFDQHPDLTPQLHVVPQLCPGSAPCITLPNDDAGGNRAHGTHVAGIVNASWDNPVSAEPPRSPRSKGVSGGNPFAKLEGVTLQGAGSTGQVTGMFLFDTVISRFDALLRAKPEGLRVINFSAGAASLDAVEWSTAFPEPTCGPGANDDALPEIVAGTKTWCTPQNADGWLREWAHIGMHARGVAELAAEENVLIVQSAGNDSNTFCLPWASSSCDAHPETRRLIHAENAVEFAWASRHWQTGTNPILIAESSRSDGFRSIFSNIAGDLAAPGTSVWSTVLGGTYGVMHGTSMSAPHITAAVGYLLAHDPDLTIDEVKSRLVEWSRPPPAAPVEPAHAFDWDTPPRYGLDAEGDGIVDAHLSGADLRPAVFPVDFDACGFAVAGKPVVSYTWTIGGENHSTGSCRFRHLFDREGDSHVLVTRETADGEATTIGRTVVVDDLVLAAIGDGVVAGESAQDTATEWQNARCHRSGRGAAAQAASWLESAHVASTVTFLNLGCLGARIRGDGPDDGGLVTPYAGVEPGDTPLPPQLDELERELGTRELDAVIVSAGAGDLGLAAIVASCVDPATDCSTGEGKTIFEERLPVLPLRFGELATRLQQLGVPAERVLVAEYGDFTRKAGGTVDLSCVVGVSAAEAGWLAESVIDGLNEEVAKAALLHGWTVVGAEVLDDHGACAAEPWFGDTLHPNTKGHTALAGNVVRAFRTVHGETPVDTHRAHGDAAPRLDVFASLLATDGAATALVDVNDPTGDGNRRVVRKPAADGTITETSDLTVSPTGPKTAPDGYVDVRDFRRFRDAWLAGCLVDEGDVSCPAATSIVLDGPPDHPKRDLNLDGCVHLDGDPAGCGADEQDFSRFDFNGDRRVSVEQRALVPLDADGQPVELRDEGTLMTDFDLLRSQWSPNPARGEGWEAADLERLLRSADLEIHADGIFSAGALTVEVQVLGPGGNPVGPARTITRRSASAVVTVPVSSIHDEFRVVARGSTSEGTFAGRSGAFTLKYGQDLRVDVGRALGVSTPTARLAADGTSAATITAKLTGPDRAGRPVTWSLSPVSGGAALQAAQPQTDDTGEATVQLVAGTEPTVYTVRAEVGLADGGVADAEVQVEVQRLVTIKYVWRQEIVDWSEAGSTRWDDGDPLKPDCTLAAGIEYCLDESVVELDPDGSPALLRQGTIRGGADAFVVTDVPSSELTAEGVPVNPGYSESSITWTQSPPDDPDAAESFATGAWWSIVEEEWDGYVDHPVEGITSDEDAEAIRVSGLHAVGDLPYTYEAEATTTQPIPTELHGLRTEFLLTEKEPENRIRFATGSQQEAIFRRTADGFEPFHSCGRLQRDLTSEPGYLVTGVADGGVIGAVGTVDRKPDYEAGDRPMPVGPGTLDVRYAFAATIAYAGEEPPDPLLPDCGGVSGAPNEPPVADFAWEAVELAEGRMIRFRDRSTDLEDELVEWKWEHDGLNGASGLNPTFTASSDEQDPWFVFPDDGPVTMKLTVTDKAGATATVEKIVSIANIAPEAYLADAAAQAGQPALLTYAVMDTGDQDKRALHVRIESSNPGWTTVERTQPAGMSGDVSYTLPAGTYPLTLTVRDANGASSSAEALLVVTDDAPAPEPDDPGPDTPTCLTGVVLDSEEQLFLDIVNDYRDANGLDPVGVSGTLSVAAAAHARDMAVNGYFSHDGLDGSTPSTRAWAAGYPTEHEVGENIARGFSNAVRVLLGWRGSTTGHNENMIVPHYEAIGIGRHQGYWATSYGPALDCEGVASGGGSEPGGDGGGEATGEPEVLSSLGGFAAQAALEEGETPATATSETEDATTRTLLPMTAFTLSDARPRLGEDVVFTNRSHEPATLELATALEVELAPGESATYAFDAAGPATVTLTTLDGAAKVRRTIDVLPAPQLELDYTGQTIAAFGGRLDLAARADDPTVAAPVPDLELEFALAGRTVTATTGESGVAVGQLDLTGLAVGTYELVVSFAGAGAYPAAQDTATIQVFVNAPPVAHAGGPYVAGEGTEVLVDASRSTDPDAAFGDRPAFFRWDLDADGAFDDGETMTLLAGSALICGGPCDTGRDYPISVRVTDLRGTSTVAATTVRFAADFAVALAGGAMTVVPGSSPSHYGVTVAGSASWTHPVTLSVVGLPAGVTATFSVNPVTTPGTSVLTLTATSTAQTGPATITVAGTSNGVTRTTEGNVSVAFGLVPQCFGTVTGVVRDRDTGEPVADVQLFPLSAKTDATGRYTDSNVLLGFNNTPSTYFVTASRTDYWSQSSQVVTACGIVVEKDFELRRKQPGHVTGVVVDRLTGAPIPNARVFSSSDGPLFTSGADGTFGGEIPLGAENAPRMYGYFADRNDYWSQFQTFTVSADSTTALRYELVKKCTAPFTGGRVYDVATGAPIANVTVSLPFPPWQATTDATGEYRVDADVLLGPDNTAVQHTLSIGPQPAIPAGSTGLFQVARFVSCEQAVAVDFPVRFPVVNTAVVEGYAVEEVSGEPIAGVSITGPGPQPLLQQTATTDATGYYRFDKVFVGFDATTSVFAFFNGLHADHYNGTASRLLTAGQVHRVDVPLLRKRFGSVDVTVADAQTGAPMGGVTLFSLGETNREGKILRDDLPLGFRNADRPIGETAFVQGYWPQTRSATLRAGETAVLDYRLVRVCAPATISGTVVNALTQEPIAGATVAASNRSAQTDASGRFTLTNIPAGENNLPAPTFVTASAPGFIPQSKQVTVYCGGSIVVDFGSRSTATSTIVGTVTNLDTGEPIAGVFVGGEHGGTATTDGAGNYTLSNVPLGDLDADREWDVTAVPAGFKQKTVSVVARAGQTVRADFGFTKAGNDIPVADPQSFRFDEDRASPPITLTGSDANGDALTYHVVLQPAHGRLFGVPPNVQYSPNANYHGTDDFEFAVFDGQDLSAHARVSLQIDSVNDFPFAAPDDATRPAGAPARIPVSLVLANDTDVDGDTLTVTGAVGFFGTTASLDGSEIVVSRLGPGDAFVSYSISDGTATRTGTLIVHFVVMPVAPACVDRTFDVVEGETLSANVACTDANGDALTYALAAPPAVGTLSLGANGSFTYAAPDGFTGETTFRFTASDGALTSAEATGTIRVAAANTAPVCGDSAFATDEDVPLTAAVACADAEADDLSYALVDAPASGTLTLAADGSFTYDPAPDAHGPVTFTYRASDGSLESALATGTIDVRPVNDLPAADELALPTDEDTPLAVVLAAVDRDGDALSFTWTQPAHGAFDGATYSPAADFHGADSFTYTADDGHGGSDTATVTIDVRPVNDAPVAPDGAVETNEDAAVAVPLPAVDVDGDTLTLTHTVPAHGTFDGSTYAPAPNYHGPDSFTYTATDASGASATGTIALTVRPVNDAPVVGDVAAATDEDVPVVIALAATDVDGDAPALSWTQPAHGTFDGTTYAPAANFHGADSFTYTADDGNGGTDTATVTVEVRPVNDAPVAPDVTVETNEDTPLALVLAGSDVDGDTLAITHAAPAHGSYDGATYTPAPDYNGADAFTYTVDDGRGGTATGTVAITVRPANDPPVVADRDVEALEDTPLPLALTGTDLDGDTLSFSWSDPAHGTYDGATYVPAAGYSGPDSFTYTADDGHGGRASATVRITVRAVVRLSVTLSGPAVTDEGGTAAFTAVAAGVPDGEPVAYSWSAGSGTITGSGASVTYANDDGPRTDSVTVTVASAGRQATASAAIDVRNVAPTVSAGADATVPWGLPLVLQGTASDPSGTDAAAGLGLRWTFSDGAPAADGPTATRAFPLPGTVTATLTATDKDGGSGSDDLAVTVVRRTSTLALTRTGATFGSAVLAARLGDATDAATAQLAGRTVVFEVAGATYAATTDAVGEAVAQPAVPLPPGEHEVVARFASDSHYLGAETRGTVNVASSSGRVTGGGLREAGGDGRGGFNALGSGGATGGELQWQTGGTKLHAHEITSVGIAPDRQSAWISGVARDGRRFTVYVEDNGEPGRNDVFRIWIDGVLRTSGSGRLAGGNVQIRGEQPGPEGGAFAL